MANAIDAQVRLTLVDRVTAGIKRISTRMAALSARMKLDRLSDSLKNVGKRFGDLTNGIAKSATRATTALGLFGASFASLFYGAFTLVKNTADAGAAITEISTKLGISAESWQEWSHTMSMAGVEASTLETAILKLGSNAHLALRGNKELSKSFRELGVRTADARGRLLPMDQIVDQTISRLADMPDVAKRNALSMKLLGKSGAELSKAYGDGSKGIAKARSEAIVMSSAAAAAGDEFGDNLDLLMNRLKSFGTILGVNLLPVFNELVVGLKDWLNANNGLIKSKIIEWAKSFADTLRSLMDPTSQIRRGITRFFDALESGYGAIKPVVDFMGGPLYASLAALGIWIAGPAVLGIGMFTAALVQAGIAAISFGAALLMNPVGAVIAGLVAIGAAVYVLTQKWQSFKDFFSSSWDSVLAAFDQGFIQGIYTLLDTFNPWKLIAKGVSEVIEYFTGIDLYDVGSRLIETLWDGLKSKWDDVAAWFSTSISSLMDSATGSIKGLFGFGGDDASKAPATAAQAVASTATQAVSATTAPIASTAQAVTGTAAVQPTSAAQTGVGSHPAPPSRQSYQSGVAAATRDWGAATRPSITTARPAQGGYAEMPRNLSIGVLNVTDFPALTRLTEAIRGAQAGGNDFGGSTASAMQPLQQHTETNIDARMNLQLTINASETDASAVAKIARREFELAGQKQLASIKASLSD